MPKAEDMDTVVLTDEEGKEREFAIVDVLEVEGKDYAVLLPMDEDTEDEEEEGDAVILRIDTDENGEDVLVDIEDDEEWEKVAEAWESLVEEEDFEDFDEEDEEEEDEEEDEEEYDEEEDEEEEDDEEERRGK